MVNSLRESFAAMCDVLYSMEEELGIAKLPYPEKRIIQVASGMVDGGGFVRSSDIMDKCSRRYEMSRATFFRSLHSLKVRGILERSETDHGVYKLNLADK